MRKIIDAHVHLKEEGLAGTTNEQFKVTYLPYGQIRLFNGWVVDGMPQYMRDSAFTHDDLVHFMESMGVEKAMILAGAPTNIEYTVEAVSKYPGKLYGAMTLKLDDNVENQIQSYFDRGLTAIKFEMSVLLGYLHPTMYPDFKFNSEILKRVFRKSGELGITITIDPNVPGAKGYQVDELEEVTDEFPETHVVICHIGQISQKVEKDSAEYRQWEKMMKLARKPNVWFDVSAMPAMFSEEEYPYKTPVAIIRGLMDQYGADKFLWGSDITSTLVHATYPQMKNMYERSPLFTEEEKDKLFYENALKAYRMD